MSTFSGIIDDIPSISIDRFDGKNSSSKIFFLSHCHMDHMFGLTNPDGLPGPLYVSPISSVIIQKQYPQIKEVVVLKTNEPTPISYEDSSGFTIYLTETTIPAFHCPGSVMFLFEKDNLKVLYTGDFRLSKRYIQRIKSLKNSVGCIDSIHIDSTFLSKDYRNFPSQIRSATTICDIIKDWLNQSSKHVISLKMPARYGYERLFIEIGKRLKIKIHINESEITKYRYIPELDGIFTTHPHKSQIHACFDYSNKNGKFLTCNPDLEPALIRVIKPTAMIWKEWEDSSNIVSKEPNEIFRVCYSNHSSLSEITDFLLYLQPKKVELNVIPTNEGKKQEMIDQLDTIMNSLKCEKLTLDLNPTPHWDNLSKISKIDFKFTEHSTEMKEQSAMCPPKRKKI